MLVKEHTNGKPYLRRVYGYLGMCEECGLETFSKKRGARFCSVRCSKIGKRNNNWNGGIKKQQGYVHIKPKAGEPYQIEHRMVMEKFLGRKLTKHEIIHHKNAIKDDNRIENLEIIIQYDKRGIHAGEMCCPKCNYKYFVR